MDLTYGIAAGMVTFLITLQIQSSIVYAKAEAIKPFLFDPSPSVVSLDHYSSVVQKSADGKLTVYQIIELFFGDKADQAKAVAKCESGFQPTAKSKISSASGLFQIIKGTWKGYKCDGDPFNPVDNTRCAKKIYDNNRSWKTSGGWEASAKCHQQP
jgi:hypothetical protein